MFWLNPPHQLIFVVFVIYVKSKRMVKILYLLYHCGIQLCIQISSVVFSQLWIMYLCYVPCSWCRRWLLTYYICVCLINLTGFWIKNFLLRGFPMYKICWRYVFKVSIQWAPLRGIVLCCKLETTGLKDMLFSLSLSLYMGIGKIVLSLNACNWHQ